MSDVLCTNGAAKKGLKRPTDYDYAHASCISAPARPLNETGPSQRAIERRGGEERTDAASSACRRGTHHFAAPVASRLRRQGCSHPLISAL